MTTHTVDTLADAERILGFYRQRWTIEQVFRNRPVRAAVRLLLE